MKRNLFIIKSNPRETRLYTHIGLGRLRVDLDLLSKWFFSYERTLGSDCWSFSKAKVLKKLKETIIWEGLNSFLYDDSDNAEEDQFGCLSDVDKNTLIDKVAKIFPELDHEQAKQLNRA